MTDEVLITLQGLGRNLPTCVLRQPLVQELGDRAWIWLSECAFVHLSHQASQLILGVTLTPKPALEDPLALSVFVFAEIDSKAPGDSPRSAIANSEDAFWM